MTFHADYIDAIVFVMVGWEISRHPEWDMMYEAGLTAREISDLCHQVPATVYLHVRKREQYEPGYQARHEKALKSREPNRPSTKWRARATEAVEFHATHNRLPSIAGDQEEGSLYRWMAVQRRAYAKGELPESKVVLLSQLPGWNVRILQRELDLRWLMSLGDLRNFVADHGFLPRYKTFKTESEHSLGVWLHNQHQLRTKGKLSDWRLKELNRAVPGWKRNT